MAVIYTWTFILFVKYTEINVYFGDRSGPFYRHWQLRHIVSATTAPPTGWGRVTSISREPMGPCASPVIDLATEDVSGEAHTCCWCIQLHNNKRDTYRRMLMSSRTAVHWTCKNIIYVHPKTTCRIKVGKNRHRHFILDYSMRCSYDLVPGLVQQTIVIDL